MLWYSYAKRKTEMSHTAEPVKDAAKTILKTLSDTESWEDVQYHLYVRQQIDAALEDEAASRLIDTDEMQKRLVEYKNKRREATDCSVFQH